MTSDMHVSKDKVKHLHDPGRFCPYIVIEMEISKQAEKRVVSGFDTATLAYPYIRWKVYLTYMHVASSTVKALGSTGLSQNIM